jgi:DNA mismatch endonuclease (patch repair protein)
VKNLPGKPDIVLPKYNTVILVHGCFWHGHEGCPHFVVPKTRTQWWLEKINKNRELDLKNYLKLKEEGWKIVVIFECQLKLRTRQPTLAMIVNALENPRP